MGYLALVGRSLLVVCVLGVMTRQNGFVLWDAMVSLNM